MSVKLSTIHVLNCPVHAVTMNETVSIIENSIIERKPLRHVVINAAKVVNMLKDKELHNSVVSSDLINADGQSIVWAARILGHPLPERVAGIDIMEKLVELAYIKNYRIFFLGAEESIVKKIVVDYSEKYNKDIIAGYNHGYFSENDDSKIANSISKSKADILFVAMTSPRKEIFLNKYKNTLNVPFIMGVGGSFDVISGKVKRAPVWMQKYGLEWLYRLIQEPRRMWKRYLITNTLFVFYVFKKRLNMLFNSH